MKIILLLSLCGFCATYLRSKRVHFTKRFNPWTSSHSKEKQINESAYDCSDCSWNKYKLNSEVTEYEKLNEYNDINIPLDNPRIVCIPESFGYTHEEADSLFPVKHFPDCESLLSYSDDFLFIDTKTNQLTMNCTRSKYKGKFVLGENANTEVLGLREFQNEFRDYTKPVNLKNNEEYAYATCTEDKEKYLENVVYHHRPKPETMNSPPVSDPVIIINLVFDSVSRRSFYRGMNKTAEYLNQINGHFKVFDMKIHNIMGEYSANNILPQLLGDVDYNMFKTKVDKDYYYDRSIWKQAKEKNFTTLFIEEGCTNDLARYLGKGLKVDHICTSFWCAARKYNDFENNLQKQRCIGKENSHVYVYNYVTDFSKNYQHRSQWVFAHMNTAHEDSGLLISTMDKDTVNFLKKYLEQQQNTKTIIMITGDHGMRYGEWFKRLDGSHEHRLPLFLIIASNSLLESIPYSIDTLQHNSNRLTSKLDLYTTQQHLINLVDQNFDLNSHSYQLAKRKTSDRYDTISVLLEKVINNRTCAEIGIPTFWCSCLKFEEAEDIPDFIYYLVEEIIYQINEDVYTPRLDGLGHICQKLHFDSIHKLWVLSTDEEFYKMQFSIKESDTVLFESVVMATWKKYRPRSIDDAYTYNPYYNYGKRIMNIMYIRRVDSYAGKCEDKARNNNLDPALCVCKPDN